MDIRFALHLALTREKLRRWGMWYHSTLRMGLGFSNTSLLGQLIDTKGELIKRSNQMLAPENQEMEMLDDLINELAQSAFKTARVLCIHYTVDSSSDQKIQKACLSRTTYFRHLAAAETWLSERLQ